MHSRNKDNKPSIDDCSSSTSGLSDSSFEPKNGFHRRKRGSKRSEKSYSSSPLNEKARCLTQNKSSKVKGPSSKITPPNKKSIGKLTASKTHDRPMGKRDMYFALDCEMVGVGPEGLDSALARVSIVNWDNEVVLDTYVRVEQPVTDYRTFVSGVTKENIQSDSAMPIEKVRFIVANMLRGKILIGHALENDLNVMGLSHPLTDIRDTAKYEPFMRSIESKSAPRSRPILRPRKLKDLVFEKIGEKIQVMGKAHSPIEDAKAAMALYKSVRPEWEQAMINELHRLEQENLVRYASPQNVYSNGLSSMHFASPRNVSYLSHFVPPVPHQLRSSYSQGPYMYPHSTIQSIHNQFQLSQSQQKMVYI